MENLRLWRYRYDHVMHDWRPISNSSSHLQIFIEISILTWRNETNIVYVYGCSLPWVVVQFLSLHQRCFETIFKLKHLLEILLENAQKYLGHSFYHQSTLWFFPAHWLFFIYFANKYMTRKVSNSLLWKKKREKTISTIYDNISFLVPTVYVVI